MNKTILGLFLIFALAYLLPLGSRSLVAPDETRYGEIAREMNASGDYVVPRINGLRYFEKPAGGHIFNAMSMKVFGESHFGVRFASTLSVGLAALALFLLVRREFDEETAGLSTLIYLTMMLVQGIGTFNTLDSMVSAFITLCLCFFYRAATEASPARRGMDLFWVGVFAGLAFLVKGFLAFVVPVLVIAPFLLWRKEWKRLFTMVWLPLLGILIVALPWSLMIAAREPDFWHYFFFEEHLHRFLAKDKAEHSEPLWFFIPVLLVGALPWLFLSWGAVGRTLKTRLDHPFIRLSVLWVAMPFLFFSASSGKLPTYILPVFPPLAVLFAVGLLSLAGEGREKSIRVGMGIFFGVTCVGIVGLLLSAVLPIDGAEIYAPDERGKFLDMLVTLGVSAGLYGVAMSRKEVKKGLAVFGLATAALMAGAQTAIPERGSVSAGLEGFLRRNARHMPDHALLVGCDRTTHSVCFVFQRDDAYVLKGMGELDYGLNYEDAQQRFLETREDFLHMFENRGTNPVVCAVRTSYLDDILPSLPEPVYEDSFRYITFAVYPPAHPISVVPAAPAGSED